MNAVFAVLLLGPLVMAAAAALIGRRRPRLAGRLGAATAGLGFLGAAVLAVAAAVGHPASLAIGSILAASADRLAVVLLLLVFGVSAIVQTYAIRYLAGDDRAGWFSAGAGLLTSASATLMAADTLVVLALGWTAAGVALCLLLATYWQLPAARTDFIFTVIGERYGIPGCAGLMLLYGLLLVRGFRIAQATQEPFGRLVVVGIVTMLGTQVVINTGMTVGLMPITGITLPLCSYGGSSLVATSAAIGLLMNIAMRPGYEVAARPFAFRETAD